MKLILIITVLLFSFQSFGKDKVTVFDKINKATTIPVYIIHGKVISTKYMYEPPLNQYEIGRPKINGQMPSGIDSLKGQLLKQLKSDFNSDKFVFIRSGSGEEIKKEIHEKQLDFVVVVSFSANYGYDHIKYKPRRETIGTSSVLVTKRKISGAFNIGFYESREINYELKKLARTGSLVYDANSFIVKGYTEDATLLMEKKSPLVLKTKFAYRITIDIPKMAEKLKKKHEKVISKRK